MTYYIYILLKNDCVFYVGSSIRPSARLQQHIRKFGFKPDMEIVDEMEAACPSDVRNIEGYWIWQFKVWGFSLFNKRLIVDRVDFLRNRAGKGCLNCGEGRTNVIIRHIKKQ